ncbi:MAG: DUF488 domain-containing protein [Planctomycetota bacterium]
MRILTVGHSTHTLESLTSLLKAHGVEVLCDVRAFPGSKRHPHFARENLAKELAMREIAYLWLGRELGGFRKGRGAHSAHIAVRTAGFRNYADHMEGEMFAAGVDRLLEPAADKTVAIMCAERHWSRCHRSFLSDYLVGIRGVEVLHLLDEGTAEPHRLRSTARVDGERLFYDLSDAQLDLFDR